MVWRFSTGIGDVGFPGGSAFYEGDLGLLPGLGRSPGGRHGNLLQYSWLENPHGQRSLVGYNPWGHKESDTIEQLSTHWRFSKLIPITNGYLSFGSPYLNHLALTCL